jgi:hypothetical protein
MWAHSRTLGTVAIMFATALFILSAVQTSAWANQEDECDSGEVCMFKDAHYDGGWYDDVGDEDDYEPLSYSGCTWSCGVNDATSSIDNDGNSCDSWHYTDAHHEGSVVAVDQGGHEEDLSVTHPWANDELSSHEWVSCG